MKTSILVAILFLTNIGFSQTFKEPSPKGHNCTEYGKVSLSKEFGLLDGISVNLRNDERLIAIYLLRTKRNLAERGMDSFISKRLGLLSKKLGIAKERIIFVFEQDKFDVTNIGLWIKGTEEIKCKNCKIIKDEDFYLKRL